MSLSPEEQRRYEQLVSQLLDAQVDIDWVEVRLRAQRIETPSWAYGNSGTRFRVFPQRGVPRDPFEKLADAAQVYRLTGICPSIAIHIPWDRVDDFHELQRHAASLGLSIGAVNPNLFQDEDYRLGSLCHPDERVRRKAVEHLLECIDIARTVSSPVISLWLADGTNYPGQDSFVARRHRLFECLSVVYDAIPKDMRLFIEYKLFEPGFYHSDVADWGFALAVCRKLGDRAQVLVDIGHHAQGINVEHIVATLLDEGALGGFHFNSRKYADDDLMVGAINPFELFLIFVELIAQEDRARDVAYMIDQSHNIEPKIEAMMQSVVNIQESYARALLVDRSALDAARTSGDILGAYRVLTGAYNIDVRPLCAKVRVDLGGSADPISTFRESGYLERIALERAEGTGASWT